MNPTTGIFSQYERDELNKITAKSILEKLMNNRQNINVEFTARRLVWELIQNAKDNASLCNQDGEMVDVSVAITDDKFIFTHNKGFFTNEHIRGLIRKYSSSDKERDTEHPGQAYKTTGRFGTGFMTTHLLSEKVQVSGHYKNEDGTFHPFNFWLDRTGKSEAKITEGINAAFDEAEASIAKSQATLLSKGQFQTSFIYPLTDPKRTLANIAFEEVEKGVAYTLINVPEINSITLIDNILGDAIYTVTHTNTFSYQEDEIKIHQLQINGNPPQHYFLSVTRDHVQIIVPISYKNNTYYASKLESTIPRLHLDFPMIGTEDLNVPFVINSPLFEPTEQRDGISLMNDETNEIAQMNCALVLKAVDMYNMALNFVGQHSNWEQLYNLARIKNPKKHNWIDQEWFIENIVGQVKAQLLHTPLVNTVNGTRVAMFDDYGEAQVYFPEAEKKEWRESIWDLLKKLHPQFTPIKDDLHEWHEILWNDCYKYSLPSISEDIQSQTDLADLQNLIGPEEEVLSFLNDYYRLVNAEGIHIKDIITDQFAVIPNQLGIFRKKTELFIDEQIDEELKNAYSMIATDPRDYLIQKHVYTGAGIKYHSKKNDNIILEINTIIKANTNNNIPAACFYLVSLFPEQNIPDKRNCIFELAKEIYPGNVGEKGAILQPDDKIWEEADKKIFFYIVSKISGNKTVATASATLGFTDQAAFLQWLDTLITFLVKEGFSSNINRENNPVLPNQNGVFCKKDNLFLDDGTIHETLKDIAKELGHDFRDTLLDKSIFLELPDNRTFGIVTVAEKISTLLTPVLRDVGKRKNLKETLSKFYVWMNEHRDDAASHFSDLFERRFLFLEDEDISTSIKKASEFDKVLDDYGITSVDELRNKLANLTLEKEEKSLGENEKINVTKEILVSLGISSQEELEEALKDPAISSRFYHTSTPTTDMYIYAQRLIHRAKENIIKHLHNHPDYDCTDLEETARTILAGVVKNGMPINIVARPSDNGEVIIYYPSEKDTLDTENAELWVDNGSSEPHILTLGRILKSTGINRIPINMH